MERLNKFLYGLGTGVIIGTAAGLLLAPKPKPRWELHFGAMAKARQV